MCGYCPCTQTILFIMYKALIRMGTIASAFMFALLIPLASKADKLVEVPVGGVCDPTTAPCVATATGTTLQCGASNRCVPLQADIAMGTWCSHSAHCDIGTGKLELTCDVANQICVGATANVACSDPLVSGSFNTADDIGWLLSDSTPNERCAEGLYCDTVDTGTCQEDFGQGAVPTDKLGETATDIRDQIRNLINIALGFLGVAGVIVMIYGGALWMSAAGDDEKVEKAKKTIVSGLIGLVIIGIAWTIVSYVLNVTQDIS